MNFDQELRQLRIALITETPHRYSEMAVWFFKLWENLHITRRQNKTIFHHTSVRGEWAFYIQDDENILWCNLKSYAEVVCIKFGITRADINDVNKLLVTLLLEQSSDSKIQYIDKFFRCDVCRHITFTYILEDYPM